MKRNGLIYKAEDTILHKVYIGQTQQGFENRKNEHLKKAFSKNDIRAYHSVFYKAIRFIGSENFKWEILENNIDGKDLDKKEAYYIRKYNSFDDGWNSSMGGNYSYNTKINFSIALEIQRLLKETNLTYKEIAEKFSLTSDNISDINCGETWFNLDIAYPIRSLSTQKNFSNTELKEIIELLKTDMYYEEIAKKFNCCRHTIKMINDGKTASYKITGENYPIRKKQFEHLSDEIIKQIVESIKHDKNLSQQQIAKKLNIRRKNISNINLGKYHQEDIKRLFPDITFPIRIF